MQDVTIISLNKAGKTIADTLHKKISYAHLLHRPKPFKQKIQSLYSEGHRLIFICSTGIVIRCLADVLQDKHTDPCVIVIDDQARFVIPLISAHEGGGHALADELAKILHAQCVYTGETRFSSSYRVLGIGCIKNCSLESVQALYQSMQEQHGPLQIQALASINIKQQEPALLQFSETLQRNIEFYTAEELVKYDNLLSERSEYVNEIVGCYGVAEAAALKHCEQITGNQAKLVINKLKSKQVTMAVAEVFVDE